MDYEQIIYSALEVITGITREDFAEYSDVHLLESGILDSLSIVTLLAEISAKVGKQITIESMHAEYFQNIDVLVSSLKGLL